jgi:hypothetical protein
MQSGKAGHFEGINRPVDKKVIHFPEEYLSTLDKYLILCGFLKTDQGI